MEPKFSAPYSSTSATPSSSYRSALPTWLSPVGSALDSISSARERLNLPDPGKIEDLGKEVKATHLSLYTFEGAKADLAKTFSSSPLFQVTHSFAAGGSAGPMGAPSTGTYNFSAVYAAAKTLLTGAVDNDGTLNGRVLQTWSPRDTSKIQLQFPGKGSGGVPQVVLDHDRVGKDYALNFKAFNPSPTDLTGSYGATYLQSITQHVAVGIDAMFQKQSADQEESAIGYLAKWHDVKKDAQGQPMKDSWIATGQLMTAGLWQFTYWRKLAERIDAGVDLVVVPSLLPTERKAVATAGVKYDFRQATFRGQVESTGKVSALLEHRITPSFSFLVAGELDHMKNTCKTGFGIQIESADEAVMEQAAQQAQAAGASL